MDRLKRNRIKMSTAFARKMIPFLKFRFSLKVSFFLSLFFFRFSIMCLRVQFFFFFFGGGGKFVNMPTRRYQFITLAEGRQLRSTKEKIFLPNTQINCIGLRRGCKERFASKVHFQVILNFNPSLLPSNPKQAY